MTGQHGSGSPVTESAPRSRGGLRPRIWVGCLGAVLVAAAGTWWVLSSAVPTLEVPWSQLGIALGAALLVGAVLAQWLERGIVHRARRLVQSVRTTDARLLQDPASRGWGELAELNDQMNALITRYRQAQRASEQLQAVERQLDAVREGVQRWIETERWSELPPGTAGLQGIAESLNRGFARHAEVSDQNQEAARQVRTELTAAIEEARETAEQAERGFVEATALLTTVRELQRLSGELQSALAAGEPAEPPRETWMGPVSEALQELVDSASESVEHLASGLSRVQQIAEHVQVLGNRSTLIALNALLAARAESEVHEPPADELKQLAREAREATDRVHTLAREVESQVRAAGERMAGVRERVGERLDRIVPQRAESDRPPGADVARLLERVREMVQDTTQKAERLSAAGERASRAAHRLAGRLDEEVRDVEGLIVRLTPPRPGDRPAPPQRFTVVDRERPAPPAAPQAGEERR